MQAVDAAYHYQENAALVMAKAFDRFATPPPVADVAKAPFELHGAVASEAERKWAAAHGLELQRMHKKRAGAGTSCGHMCLEFTTGETRDFWLSPLFFKSNGYFLKCELAADGRLECNCTEMKGPVELFLKYRATAADDANTVELKEVVDLDLANPIPGESRVIYSLDGALPVPLDEGAAPGVVEDAADAVAPDVEDGLFLESALEAQSE